jgi:hypothetical protein
MPVVLHGDAAFSGQGIVPEVMEVRQRKLQFFSLTVLFVFFFVFFFVYFSPPLSSLTLSLFLPSLNTPNLPPHPTHLPSYPISLTTQWAAAFTSCSTIKSDSPLTHDSHGHLITARTLQKVKQMQ